MKLNEFFFVCFCLITCQAFRLPVTAPAKCKCSPRSTSSQIRLLDRTAVAASHEIVDFFETTNIRRLSPRISAAAWEQLVPPRLFWKSRDHQSIVDVEVQWKEPNDGVTEVLDVLRAKHGLALSTSEAEDAAAQLREIHSTFTRIHGTDKRQIYKTRIVATRGLSGIKCSRFHEDWVPVRLICALVGPGVKYIDEQDPEQTSWRNGIINESDEVDSRAFNRLVERRLPSSASIQECRTGEIALLMGKGWCLEGRHETKSDISAVVHRSPDLKPGQGRVLLTVDVVPNN